MTSLIAFVLGMIVGFLIVILIQTIINLNRK